MSEQTQIALVGHCGPDAFALQSSVMGFVPGSVIHRINSADELSSKMPELALLLVNRVLDGRFGSESGIELIENLSDDAPPAMLISNFQESLLESVAAGAVMGYGKKSMRSPEAESALLSALKMS
jgi:hypothetical protein